MAVEVRRFNCALLALIVFLFSSASAQVQDSDALEQQTAPLSLPTTSIGPAVTQSIRSTTQNYDYNQNQDIPQNQRTTRQDQSEKLQDTAARRMLTLPPDPLTGFQRLILDLNGKTVPIFGASIFRNAPSTFAPVDQIPVPSDYVIGPGDQLLIQLFGQVNQSSRYVVDRTGNVVIPDLGPVHVAGLQYSQLRETFKSQFSKFYRNFDLTVQLGDLRSIQIFVLGEVHKPGSFTVSSLSSLVNALFVSGGPSPNGSVRKIQLKRNGKVVTDFDLYALLLKGDKSKDVKLLPGDIIYVPPVGPQVALVGSVTQSAIYELKNETTVGQVLDLSGGLTNTADNSPIRIERIADHQALVVAQAPLTPEGRATPVQNGDILTVLGISESFRNAVTLRGNVARPGRYVWHDGMTVRDLIPNEESLITPNYWMNVNRLGIIPTRDDETPQESSLALSMHGNNQTGGAASMRGNRPVGGADSLQGNSPAGGYDATQGNSKAGVYDSLQGNNQVGGTDAMRGNRQAAGATAASIADSQSSTGNSFAARNYVVLSAADIDWSYAVIERLNRDTLKTSLIPFNLGKLVLDGDLSQNFPLQSGDIITIFSTADIEVPQSQRTRFVRLEGEVVSAGIYSVRPGENLADLIVRAGGLTSDAYLYGATFTRESTQRLQQQRLNEYLRQLQNELQQQSVDNVSNATSASDAAANAASLAAAQASVQGLASIQASGRIILGIRPDAHDVAAVPRVALEDGDRLVVPRLPSEVMIVGSVYNQNAVLFVPGVRVAAYLRDAGGPNRNADPKKEFIIRADGSLISRQYMSKHKFENARIYPGDTIVVPERLNKGATLRNIVAYSQILGQVGFAAAALNAIN